MDGVRGRRRKRSKNSFKRRLIITEHDCIREFYKKI
jgi:hypothetical protein